MNVELILHLKDTNSSEVHEGNKNNFTANYSSSRTLKFWSPLHEIEVELEEHYFTS